MTATINSNGIAIPYLDLGGGTPVVFVHGLGMSGAAWGGVAEKIRAAGFRTLTYDQRGFGEADLPREPYSVADLAADLANLLDHLRIDRFHLVGHSLGGTVAQHFAIAQARRVLSLTLVCTSAHMGQRASRFATGIAKLAELGFDAAASSPTARAEIEAILAEGFPMGPPPFEMFRRGLERPNPAQALAWRAMIGFSVKAEMAVFARPTLVMHGTHDVWIPFGNGQWLGDHVPAAKWLPIQGAGHFPQLKQPDWFVQQCLEFWANCQSSGLDSK